MGYQVLARKWRPKNFHQLVGQDHVSRALINALDTDRLHHAYLFTGTRGVGKTTLARILAKCLNCETGVTSEPCGVCSTCEAIDTGRFVDLIEVDAASRTKVEDTRELLDNVQYAPSQGRFKVYLIDEVHMLSTHSFNALLKTLEEPPPHVKFLLATTDPQKLPATVLSRCLQFQLKNMPPERVVEHLRFLLAEEKVGFDEASLWLLGRAADGSMRDALSLTDQAIAFGQGNLAVDQVATMLGVLDHQHLLGLLRALVSHDPAQLMAVVGTLAEQAPDFAAVLQDLASLLHRLTLAQVVPEALPEDQLNRDELIALAASLPAEEVQLYYQLAIEGRRDLPLAPDPRTGLEMTLLRMLAFRPQGIPELPEQPLSPKTQAPEANLIEATPAEAKPVTPITQALASNPAEPVIQGQSLTPVAPLVAEALQLNEPKPMQVAIAATVPSVIEPSAIEIPAEKVPAEVIPAIQQGSATQLQTNEDWLEVFDALNLQGWAGTQIRNLCLLGRQGQSLNFAAPAQALAFIKDDLKADLQSQLEALFKENLQLTFEARDPLPLDNISVRRERLKDQLLATTLESLQEHPHIQVLQQIFQAKLDVESVVPAAWLEKNTLH
ncbi:MAG: DNA polymerase III subunit gamma/tau [Pseudomonadaceae bacterium]|nr:DNA polymerase III subunit gamma/tau [Pseudomonadaceae bacterium]